MNGFEKRALLIKEKIKKTALDMLKTWEPKRIRITDIAKEANVSPVTIYNYFGSKEALLKEVFKDYIDQSISDFEEYMNKDISVKEKIELMILQKREANNQKFALTVVKEVMIEDSEIMDYVKRQYDEKVIPLMLQMIEEGHRTGEISPKITAESFLIFMNMIIEHSKTLGEAFEKNRQFTEEMMHIFFYGLCGRP
ncbi:TetR/AcrR family transcriptional regulator [Bacillus paralicheniformis]|jgi:AcrR family transcriptional regulator|uniref:TetR/AcrR family transcriptional regulator n=1 Tax=Bacillus paralicheniformis TaxID=1648923 RepID=UPI00034231B6|nr:TetR/AcrR family transcriptional regulator [Bacillus paralicheniformis]KJD54625.1 TetR family transcriptional regulator [Bacillus amyloliquefaciens]KUL09183.1 TetR family transcriptional regulator [Bacillus licheniformis LMG 7559]AGN34783.1 transcriptional regulator [Bacillus paralicheniformis ATCC 9945a]AYQ14925.1 TetR/AcrR family transcriptional regulator [Bacillus paralicheniformis]KRT91223.1 TetR family transcriptional regulator [Bacillus paralicheniformis]